MLFQKNVPPMPHVKGGLKLNETENKTKMHFSQVSIETAFDNCAKGCPKFDINDNPPVLLIGTEKFHFIKSCKHIKDCELMAKHLAKQVTESED